MGIKRGAGFPPLTKAGAFAARENFNLLGYDLTYLDFGLFPVACIVWVFVVTGLIIYYS